MSDGPGAPCAVHPDVPSAGTCPRCGDFACAACLEAGLCRRCAERAGGALWPAGRALSGPGLVLHAASLLPREVGPILGIAVLFLPLQVASVLLVRQQGGAAPGAMPSRQMLDFLLVMCGWGVVALALTPLLWPALAARAADDVLGRERRPFLATGASLYVRSAILAAIFGAILFALSCLQGLLAIPILFAAGGPGALGAGGAPPAWFFALTWALQVVTILPLMFVWFLAQAALVIEGQGPGAATGAALRFVRANVRSSIALFATHGGLTAIAGAFGFLAQRVIVEAPWIAVPYGVLQALVGAAMLVLWQVVFVAFYLARAGAQAPPPA